MLVVHDDTGVVYAVRDVIVIYVFQVHNICTNIWTLREVVLKVVFSRNRNRANPVVSSSSGNLRKGPSLSVSLGSVCCSMAWVISTPR
jgi:hypothetical protein